MFTRRSLPLAAAVLACAFGSCDDASEASRCRRQEGEPVSGAILASADCPPGERVAEDKPFGPVAVLLQSTGAAGGGQALHATLRPVRTLGSVAWHWELSGGAALLEGAVAGSADPEGGVISVVDAIVRPPSAGASGRAMLVTKAVFEGADTSGPTGPEITIQSVEFRWGEGDPSSVPIVSGFDAATGEATSFALVPSSQRPGR